MFRDLTRRRGIRLEENGADLGIKEMPGRNHSKDKCFEYYQFHDLWGIVR